MPPPNLADAPAKLRAMAADISPRYGHHEPGAFRRWADAIDDLGEPQPEPDPVSNVVRTLVLLSTMAVIYIGLGLAIGAVVW